MKRLFLLLGPTILLFTTALHADTFAQLKGTIVDDSTGKPVIGAVIRVIGTRHGAFSKAPNGHFVIGGIAPGNYDVEVTSIGYERFTMHVTLSAGTTVTLASKLTVSTAPTKCVCVMSGRPPVRYEHAETIRSVTSDGAALPANDGSPEPRGTNGFSLRGGRATGVDGAAAGDPFTGGFGSSAAGYSPTGVATLSGAPTVDDASSRGGPGRSDGVTTSERSDTTGPADRNYEPITENEFIPTRREIFSTFSIDVDAASYTNIRRLIASGIRPARDAVRIEEMINYFHYGYPDPVDEHPFSINTEIAACPWNPEHRLVRVGLQGRHIDKEELPAASLVFLIDVSGSMMPQTRLPLIKSGLKLLVNELRAEDRVAIVVYAGAAGLVLPSTSGAKKQEIIAAIDGMNAGGSTAGGAGIELAYKVALESFRTDGNNRVILATDGDFNVGISDTEQLVSLIEEKRKSGIYLTVLGVGDDNLRDGLMEQLADHGNGNYYYLDRIDEAQRVLVGQLAGTLFTIAKDVKIQVEFNPELVASYRLIGYENRMLATQDFTDDRKDAGELGAGHSVTALYEIVPVRAAGAERKGNGMDLSTIGDGPLLLPPLAPGLKEDEMMAIRLRYKPPTDSVSRLIVRTVENGSTAIESASEDFRFATAVAELGLLLRASPHGGTATLDDVLKLAHESVGADTDGRRADFITMAEKYRGTTTSGD